VVRGGSNTPTITVIIGKVYKLIEVIANHIIKGGGVWGGVTKEAAHVDQSNYFYLLRVICRDSLKISPKKGAQVLPNWLLQAQTSGCDLRHYLVSPPATYKRRAHIYEYELR
jgi:hypothetical protein